MPNDQVTLFIEEEKSPDITPSTPTEPENSLFYLKGLPEDDLEKLTATYGKSSAELEALITQNKMLYYFFYFNYCLVNYGNCLLYLYFPITTSSAGLNSIAYDFDANATIPDDVNYSFNWPLAILYVLFDMSFFSVGNVSAQMTLHWLHHKSLRETLRENCDYVYEHPRDALINSAKFIAHQSILQPCNLTGTVSELIYLPLDYSKQYIQAFTGAVMFYGNEFFRNYTNIDYYAGLDFFLNKIEIKRTWRERNFSTVLQIILRSISGAGLTVYPLYYFIAVAAEQTLGWWFPPNMIAGVKTLHSFVVFSPVVYHNYMDDYFKVLSALKNNPETTIKIQNLLQINQLEDNETNRHQMLLKVLQEFNSMSNDEIKEKHRYLFFYFVKNYLIEDLLVLVRTGLGLYFGYGVAQSVSDKMSPTASYFTYAISMLVFSGLFGLHLYTAELDRVLYHYRANKIAPNPKPQLPSKSDSLALFLNISGGLTGFMSTLGTLQDLVGTNSPQLTTTVTLLALERMLNIITFTKDRIKATMRSNVASLPSLNIHCCVFNKSNTATPEEKNKIAPVMNTISVKIN